MGNPGGWVEAEVSVAGVTKYYAFGGGRVAMRTPDGVFYLHTDHLGSTSLATTAGGAVHSRQGYYPYGETRYAAGDLPTDFGFTGQRNDATIGLYDYHARWYDPYLNRFISADTIVPDSSNPQHLNRYAYVRNNPLRYTDPTGQMDDEGLFEGGEEAPPPPQPPPLPPGLDPWLVGFQDSEGKEFASKFNPSFLTAWGALELVRYWYYETPGTEELWFGPEIYLTQEVRNDPALTRFHGEWAASDFQLPFSWEHQRDKREGSLIPRLAEGVSLYAQANWSLFQCLIGFGSETPEGSVDMVAGILGSFDDISVYDAGDEIMFVVHNTMGYASGTRIPGTSFSLIQDVPRGVEKIQLGGDMRALGGTAHHYFYWWEPKTCPPFCSSTR